MLDAIEILLCRSAVHAAALQLRAMFEAAVYVEWILAGDRENKAAHYYVHNLQRLRVWAMRVQPGTPESISFKDALDGLPVDETLGEQGMNQVREIDRVLSQPRFAQICDIFRDWKKQNKRALAWYSPFGVTDLRKMAVLVKQEPLYVFVYGSGSEVMHASNFGHHIAFSSGRVTFRSIRHPKDFPKIVRLTASIAIDVFRKMLLEYREEEAKTRFGQKYLEKWQKAFMNIPELKVNEQDLGSQ
jgi:Family of unknown function (DUF5677)